MRYELMKHLSGIAAVLSVALVLRFWEDARIATDEHIHNSDVSVYSISFWVLAIIATVWLSLSGYAYIHRHLLNTKQKDRPEC